MIWLQLSANTGPAECCLGVAKALHRVLAEAAKVGVTASVIEQADGPVPGTLRSILLQLDGDNGQELLLARRWCGSLLWVHPSPYRPQCRRKNWFLHGAAWAPPDQPEDGGEIRYEATRASGPGGQHVNKTDSAIRITHLPTGLVAECQDDRSQHRNKAKAMAVLQARLRDKERSERAAKEAATRKGLIGSGDRSDRIRTYNFPQGRLTDHRINLTLYRLQAIVDGDLDEVIEALQAARASEQLAALEGGL